MKSFVMGVCVGALLAGTGVAMAGPAFAESLDGGYSGLLIDGTGQVLNPAPITMSFAACGVDCTRLQMPRHSVELRMQGGSWVGGYNWNGSPCTITVDGAAQVLDDFCPNEQPMRMALTKNG